MKNTQTLYLKTGLSQRDTAELLVEKLDDSIESLTYNIKRYKVPATLILIYTEENISKYLKTYMRLTDALRVIQIGDSYFNFIFLPFTKVQEGYSFIIKEKHHELRKVKHLYYFDALPPEVHSCYNLINTYLYKILEEKEKDL